MIERFSVAGNLPGFEKSAIQINDPIRYTLDLLEHQLKLDSIEVVPNLDQNLPQVLAHYNRLVQVIYNILTNAREAIESSRATRSVGIAHKILLRTFQENERVFITIEDTGSGIAEHYLDRVFEPFFTTKGTGKGKGLGLTICKQIVRDCDGRITIESSPPKGTSVTISFPEADDVQRPKK